MTKEFMIAAAAAGVGFVIAAMIGDVVAKQVGKLASGTGF